MKKSINDLNKLLINEKKIEIWNLKHFESSDSEDNDTDEEVKENRL